VQEIWIDLGQIGIRDRIAVVVMGGKDIGHQ
jgi:hypothetical protein